MTIYSLEDLQRMTPDKRRQLYQNAVDRRDKGGQPIIDLIESSGLPLHSTEGLTNDDPTFLRMEEIIWSAEGREAALKATEAGLPALSGIDPLLQRELGALYGPHDLGTASAGAVVAKLMRHLGHEEAGAGSCPEGCVAKTAMKWRPRKK
ncbi:hypothetical protein [Microvirga alba]|uniref:Uncharacterized protein n=1 Tax=Microvirga alba TaxID=2791025 RepID=A0A931BPI5_9HYPH|nr:hypothetical protein [Microvirga alba]MBF9234611.1 hypothetical protein [Microvirga alba]